MKQIIIFLLLILPLSLFAQNKVYLKNGSIINCEILEMIPDSSIKLKTVDRSIFVFNTNEVLKVESAKSHKEVNYNVDKPSQKRRPLSKGYRGFVDLMSPCLFNKAADPGVLFSTTHGYQFNGHWFLGGGVAYVFDHNWNEPLIPIYVCARVNTHSRSGFFFDTKVGYNGFSKPNTYFLELTPGYRFAMSKRFAIDVGMSAISISDDFGVALFKVGIDF